MIFGRNSRKTDKDIDTYDLDETLSVSIDYAKKRKSMLIILCGETTENYDEFLSKFAMSLYNLGLVSNPKVESQNLLSIISSSENMQNLTGKIKKICNRDRQVFYLKGFHQYEYNNSNTLWLLNQLQMLLYENEIEVPVVINMPLVVKTVMMASYPELWKFAIRYINTRSNNYNGESNRVNVYASESACKKNNESVFANSNARIQDANGRLSIGKQAEDKQYPWYKRDTELFEREMNGMRMLLKKNSHVKIETLPKTKRLNWSFKLCLNIRGIDCELELRIVYSERFSRDNLAVGIVVENAGESIQAAIGRNKRCEKIIVTDPEFDKIFMIKPIKIGKNDSAAAAALEGFVALLQSL